LNVSTRQPPLIDFTHRSSSHCKTPTGFSSVSFLLALSQKGITPYLTALGKIDLCQIRSIV